MELTKEEFDIIMSTPRKEHSDFKSFSKKQKNYLK